MTFPKGRKVWLLIRPVNSSPVSVDHCGRRAALYRDLLRGRHCNPQILDRVDIVVPRAG
jgi:hypothetical protein